MENKNTGLEFALKMDTEDDLAAFRDRFVIDDPDLIYLDGNSLGRLPKQTISLLKDTVRDEWGKGLIRSWNEEWIDLPRQIGKKIAMLVGAGEDEIILADSTSCNLFKLASAALKARSDRNVIVSDVFNFPSDLYILQGIIDFLGSKHELRLIPTRDNIHMEMEDVENAINEDTAMVALSHAAFKSAFLYDMEKITELAHKAGALILWDLSHSAGAVPVRLNSSNADMAVGCTYKYLNGGPGAPAYLYVRRELQEELKSPIWGWFAAQSPFEFNFGFEPARDIRRFEVGTPHIISMKAIEPGVDLLLEARMERVRQKSVKQTEYLIFLFDEWLDTLGFRLGSPRDAARRGSHVSLRHPEAYRITRAMIEAEPPNVRVIPDFREPDNIRLGIAPLYTSYRDIYRTMERIRIITEEEIYENFSDVRFAVT